MKYLHVLLISLITLSTRCADDHSWKKKTTYHFKNEPIDVIIPFHKKDLKTLEQVIRGIKTNCTQPINRIIVISKKNILKMQNGLTKQNSLSLKRIFEKYLNQEMSVLTCRFINGLGGFSNNL